MNNSLWISLAGIWAAAFIAGLLVLRTRDVLRLVYLGLDCAWMATCATVVLFGVVAVLEKGPGLLGVNETTIEVVLLLATCRLLVLLRSLQDASQRESASQVTAH